jgi:uncharacterized membrane protein YfcA
MTFELPFLALAAVFFLAYVTETAIGFGNMLVTLALGAQLYPLSELLPVAIALSPVFTGRILYYRHGEIDRPLLFGRIMPLMVVGALGGVLLAAVAPARLLESLFAIFVVIVSLRELVLLRRGRALSQPPLGVTTQRIGITAAGVIHGAFATGGPALVYVIARAGLGKSRLRSTLIAVWCLLNIGLTILFIADGRLGLDELPFIVALLPVVAVSVPVGEWVHDRLDENQFRAAVCVVLLLAGLVLLVGHGK